MEKSKKILFLKMSSLGDVIHTLPLATSIKRAFPNAFIGWLIARFCKEVVEDYPAIDQIFIFERQKWGGLGNFIKCRHEFMGLIQAIRSAQFDVVLDFQGLFRSGFFALASGCSQRIGFANAREFAYLAYTKKVYLPEPRMHAIDRYSLLVKELGDIPITHDLELPLSPAYEERMALWRNDNPLVILVLGARWINKRWPEKHFATLADMLVEKDIAQVAMIGAPSDQRLAEEVLQRSRFPNRLVNLVGKTSLRELTTLMKKSHVVVSNDSGPMHLAAGLKIPTIGLFGPTDPVKAGPYGKDNPVFQPSLPCVPCYKKKCSKDCFCMEMIAPSEVGEAVKKLLTISLRQQKAS